MSGDRSFPPLAEFRQRLVAVVRKNAYLVLAAAALLALLRVVEFSPPALVRSEERMAGELIGDAPLRELTRPLENPQAVALLATLRLWEDAETPLADHDPELDQAAKVLSSPIITTIYGLDASVDQAVRLENGALEIEIVLRATPRLREAGAKRRELELEHELVVRSRRHGFLQSKPTERVHLDVRSNLVGVERAPHRTVFTVDDHLFALDVELAPADRSSRGAP